MRHSFEAPASKAALRLAQGEQPHARSRHCHDKAPGMLCGLWSFVHAEILARTFVDIKGRAENCGPGSAECVGFC